MTGASLGPEQNRSLAHRAWLWTWWWLTARVPGKIVASAHHEAPYRIRVRPRSPKWK
ncbi:hypothetical protein GGTG_06566 [Gaeumannomyces tritici R3-111a-1]|uniref:Uncharacterized protein n=1 Tax=Gaeumannomyces tritici (strain R3-111a-1) TaxID=644352 RepID=J3NZ66_GAET3|nr:hypothetical protein GGTG_06566 [Gaeumannomyces tritici R3-111a-1]EJT76649.1 hypothetical protein GGTG_06566 [Gaeumannomyces tritici R3-111a-1]